MTVKCPNCNSEDTFPGETQFQCYACGHCFQMCLFCLANGHDRCVAKLPASIEECDCGICWGGTNEPDASDVPNIIIDGRPEIM